LDTAPLSPRRRLAGFDGAPSADFGRELDMLRL
jgi:hypothetical protein